MPLDAASLRRARRYFGRIGTIFFGLLILYILLFLVAPGSGWLIFIQLLLIFFGAWLVIRFSRLGIRKTIWRLRNRLLVAYLFIAVVPILLIVAMVGLEGWLLTSQVAMYLATSELDRRIESLKWAAQSLDRTPPAGLPEAVQQIGKVYEERFPGIQISVRNAAVVHSHPAGTPGAVPPKGWPARTGLLYKDGHFHGWAHTVSDSREVSVLAPFTREYIAQLVPHLGDIHFAGGSNFTVNDRDKRLTILSDAPSKVPNAQLPPKRNRFDVELVWGALIPAANWSVPGATHFAALRVFSRPSAVFATISQKNDLAQEVVPVALTIVAVLLLIVEIFALFIGGSLTRTITRAVHGLHEGTQRVMHGDFTHRISVTGGDQLGELSTSFNSMTEHLERLVAVAKEKERLQSEIEIAREVQNQLYPKDLPTGRSVSLSVHCEPARMVSGDYYDFQCIHDNKLAFAIGDVAGKGISAALLMATVQSSLRAHLSGHLEHAAAVGQSSSYVTVSTSHLVTQLNQHLHEYTSPEKYATLCFGLYDETSGVLTYTNAGHLPPVLVRDGQATSLDVNGTVVGAFGFSVYEESRLELRRGDLLVCYTDGITEPENAYGEMFGEERMIGLIAKNAHREDDFIIRTVIDSVFEWTGSTELQDDMTLLLARRT